MLIDSPRIRDRDRVVWDDQARYDAALAASARLDRLERQALDVITEWWAADDGTGKACTSWGKDSVIVAHLVEKSGLPIPLAWVRCDPFETPETDTVRDVFLETHPGVASRYSEYAPPIRNPKRGEPGFDDREGRRPQDILGEALTGRYLSGVRAKESKTRAVSISSRGLATKNTGRPIGWWTAADVFAYLHRERLPVHPVYAMNQGGAIDREWIRVHPLCQHIPHDKSDVAGWEDTYYRDVIADALRQRARWRMEGDPRGGTF